MPQVEIFNGPCSPRNFMLWSSGCSLLRAEGFFCSLDVLYGGLGISTVRYVVVFDPKDFFFSCEFFQCFVIKTLYADWIWIRISNEYGYETPGFRIHNTDWIFFCGSGFSLLNAAFSVQHNVGYASTCNSVGQTAGYFMGYVLFMALESYGLVTLPGTYHQFSDVDPGILRKNLIDKQCWGSILGLRGQRYFLFLTKVLSGLK